MDIAAVAKQIVEELDNATRQGNCTWGDKYPEAQRELFKDYKEDMMGTIYNLLTDAIS